MSPPPKSAETKQLFVESKQREHLFRNFIFDFTVLSPPDNISN